MFSGILGTFLHVEYLGILAKNKGSCVPRRYSRVEQIHCELQLFADNHWFQMTLESGSHYADFVRPILNYVLALLHRADSDIYQGSDG